MAPAAADDRAKTELPALLDEAERASPRLLAARARAEAAANVAPQKEALPDPRLSASYTNDGLKDLTLGESEFSNLTVGWEQEVPARTVRSHAAAVADAQAATLRAGSVTAGVMLRARVITLYAELWRIDHRRALLAETRTLLNAAVEAAQARYESGEGIQEGLVRAQSAISRVDLEIEEEGLARSRTEIALGAAVGRSGKAEFGPTGELPELAGPIDADALAAGAAASSPDVREASAREHGAEAQLDDARIEVKPTFSWLAAYQFRGGLDPMVMGGFSVRLPVYKDRRQERAIAGATLERAAAGHEREDAVVRAGAETRANAAEVASLDIRLRLYREAIVPQAVTAFESANAAFSSGRAEMFLVLDDLDRWIRARGEQLALSARRIAAIASIEASAGATLFEWSGPGRPR